jgi:hypothetical protein
MIEDAAAALAMLAARGSPSTAACRRAIHQAVRPDGVQQASICLLSRWCPIRLELCGPNDGRRLGQDLRLLSFPWLGTAGP